MKLELKERLEVLDNGMIVTDYAGDIVKLLINKPKNYRITYDNNIDLWTIVDSMKMEHREMAEYVAKSGFVDLSPDKKYHGWSLKEIRSEFDYDSDYDDCEAYADFWFGQRYIVGCIFVPDNADFNDKYAGMFYSYDLKIPTGTIYSREKGDMTDYGIFRDLYKVLERRDLIISQGN